MKDQYVNSLVERFNNSNAKDKRWTDQDVFLFAESCFDNAPFCLCGCGEKTPPKNKDGGSIFKSIGAWKSQGKIPTFYERVPTHRYKHKVNHQEKQALIASLLGDGHMNYPHKGSNYPKIRWNMGNKEHALYKKEFFKDFGTTYREKVNPGWGSTWHQVGTGCAYAFVEIYEKYRLDDRVERAKVITSELDEIGWAWYYGDDGHYDSKKGISYIHTEGLGEGGSKVVSDNLNKFIGGDYSKVVSYQGGTPRKTRYMVRLKVEGTKLFLSKIRKHIAAGMGYKLNA